MVELRSVSWIITHLMDLRTRIASIFVKNGRVWSQILLLRCTVSLVRTLSFEELRLGDREILATVRSEAAICVHCASDV